MPGRCTGQSGGNGRRTGTLSRESLFRRYDLSDAAPRRDLNGTKPIPEYKNGDISGLCRTRPVGRLVSPRRRYSGSPSGRKPLCRVAGEHRQAIARRSDVPSYAQFVRRQGRTVLLRNRRSFRCAVSSPPGGNAGGRTGRFPSGLGRMVGRLFRTRPSASFPPSERRPPDGSSALRGHGLRLENAAGAARTPDVLRLSGILRRAVGHLRLSRDIYLIGWRVVCKIPKNGDCRVSRNRRSL